MDMNSLFAEAQKLIPGGVNSPVRAFRSVGGTPRFIREAAGSKVIDAEGREYIDYVASWGPMILGHSHPGRRSGHPGSSRPGYQLWSAD